MKAHWLVGSCVLALLLGCSGADGDQGAEEGDAVDTGQASEHDDSLEFPMEIAFEAKTGTGVTKFTTKGASKGCGRISFPGVPPQWSLGYPSAEDPEIDYMSLFGDKLPSSGRTEHFEFALMTTANSLYHINTLPIALEHGGYVGSGVMTLDDRGGSATVEVKGRTGDGADVHAVIHCRRTEN